LYDVVLCFMQHLRSVCFLEERGRGKRGRKERLKRGRDSSSLLLLMFDWERKEEGRGGENRRRQRPHHRFSLSPLHYLYLTLILELHCFFRRFFRGRDYYPLPSDQTPTGGREESSVPPANKYGEEMKNPLFLPLPLKYCKTNRPLTVNFYDQYNK